MSKTTRILICDDDPIVHQSLSLYLDHEDFLHDSAYDGKQALEMIKKEHYDLMLLDQMMPGMTGLETSELLVSQGNHVTIVEMAPRIAPGAYFQHVDDALPKLQAAHTVFMVGQKLLAVHPDNIELENVDYVQIHPTTLYTCRPGRSFLISESVRGEGAVLYNKQGERFVNELLPRDVVTEAIQKQMAKDHMPYVRLSFLTIKDMDVRERFPNIYQKCLEEGYDITREPIPVVPAQHYFMGGVHVNSDSETTMMNLSLIHI